jgi:hypothetical protein
MTVPIFTEEQIGALAEFMGGQNNLYWFFYYVGALGSITSIVTLGVFIRLITQVGKREIKDIDKIYSLITYADTSEKDRIMKTICDSLYGNRLELARFLSTVYKVPEVELFSKESLFQELKAVGSVLVVAVPIAISII